MSDFKDMLGISRDQPAPKKKAKKKKGNEPASDEKKRSVVGKLGRANRLSREVRNLKSAMLGSKAESDAPAMVVPQFTGRMKKKAKVIKKLVPWEPFQYRSRGEEGADAKDVLLTHVRPGDDPNKNVNVFLRYNIPFEMKRYTDAQYASLLENETWTREQTDALMELCERFDARFPVVVDRWDDEKWGRKSMEELKGRFLEVQHALDETKGPLTYQVEAEKTRKRHAEILYNRTGNEVWEEFEAKKKYAKVQEEMDKARAAPARVRHLMNAMKDTSASQAPAKPVKGEKHEAWSPTEGRKGKPGRKKSVKNTSQNFKNSALATAVDKYLRELKVPIRPSASAKVGAAHAQLRNQVMITLDMEAYLKQKLFEVEVLKTQIELMKGDLTKE